MLNQPLAKGGKSASSRPRVYLAGPDVFLPDAVAFGKKKKSLCSEYGLEGVFPIDSEIGTSQGTPQELGLRISKANEELIRDCDAVIANMTPFRGVSADVGTAYEMGFACALGLIVFAYSNVATPFTERILLAEGKLLRRDKDGILRDENNMMVEDWGLMDNLMLEGGTHTSGGSLVVEAAPAGELFTYLGGFSKCLSLLTKALDLQ